MKRIYLDVCTLCRPFDNQNFARIRLETEAVNLILSKVRAEHFEFMKSPVHIKEISSITDDFERIELLNLLNIYGNKDKYNSSEVRKRAEDLVEKKFGPADAAHVAFAEHLKSYFISCDDKLLKACKKNQITVHCLNPVAFCEMENLR